MNADQDDAPYYLQRTQPRANLWRWLLALAFGTLISLGLLFLAGQSFQQPTETAAPMPVVSPVLRSQPAAVIEARVAAPNSPVAAPAPAANAAKQTVFNDHNYQPKPLVNSLSMPPVTTPSSRSAEGAGTVTGIAEKPMACWPFREGSIEYRDCKRAVQLNSRNR
ncbi:hypothetical protein ACVW0Y_000421 [Pseudomonas sp. TE3786]